MKHLAIPASVLVAATVVTTAFAQSSAPSGRLDFSDIDLDRYADGLHEGEFVARGTVIGYVGITGNAPPGTPHLHFAIENLPPTKEWWRGDPINPYPLLMTNGVTLSLTTPVSELR